MRRIYIDPCQTRGNNFDKSCQIFRWQWKRTVAVWPVSQINLNQVAEIAEGGDGTPTASCMGSLFADPPRNIFVPDIEAPAYKYAANGQ